MSEISTSSPSFFKKNDRLLTVAGALLVFITFIVKEHVQAKWKETANAIEAAQMEFSIRTDIDKTLQSEAELNTRMFLMQHKESPDFQTFERLDNASVNSVIYFQTVNRSLDHLEMINELIEALPANESLRKESEYAKDLLMPLADALDEAQNDGMNFAERTGGPYDQFRMRIPDTFPATSLATIDGVMNKLWADTLSSAESAHVSILRKERMALWLSSVLFIIGWALALVGKLSHTEIFF